MISQTRSLRLGLLICSQGRLVWVCGCRDTPTQLISKEKINKIKLFILISDPAIILIK